MKRAPVETAIFAAIALVSVSPALLRPGHMAGDGVDAFGTYWFFWWIRTCIENFGDPSFTRLFFWPMGKDILAHTGNNFVDAVLSVPFQWALGPVRYQPWFVAFFLLGNALTFRPLARYLLPDDDRAFAATLLWMVNPYTLFEITAGRPTQAFLWFVPAAVLYFLRCARETSWGNAWRFGAAVACAAWTYWFVGYFLVFLFVPLAVMELRDSRDRVGTLKRWGFSAAFCILLVLPAAIPMAAARAGGAVPGVSEGGSIFSLPDRIGNNVAAELHGLLLAEFFGAPLLSSPAWGLPLVWAAWRGGMPRRWLAVLLLVLLVAVGTTFRWENTTLGVNVPYMVLYHYLPFFDRLWFPYRAASVAFLAASLLIAASLPAGRRGLVVAAFLAVVGLGWQSRYAIWPFATHDARCPPLLAALRGQGGAMITLPFQIQHDGLIWQTTFRLPTLGGMGESAGAFWPKGFIRMNNNRFFRALRAAVTDPTTPRNYADSDRAFVEDKGFRWVMYRRDLDDPNRHPDRVVAFMQEAVADVSEVVGHPPAGVDGPVVLWDLRGQWTAPAGFEATPERLATFTWTLGNVEAWNKHLALHGRQGRAQQ